VDVGSSGDLKATFLQDEMSCLEELVVMSMLMGDRGYRASDPGEHVDMIGVDEINRLGFT
jgi:hypothetical protein